MKKLFLAICLLLTACGTEVKPTPVYEVVLPATFTTEGTIVTSGATLGEKNCSTTWPAVMPYEVDGAGTYHANGEKFEAVDGMENTWRYSGERVNGYKAITTFTVGEDSFTIRLNCDLELPIEQVL